MKKKSKKKKKVCLNISPSTKDMVELHLQKSLEDIIENKDNIINSINRAIQNNELQKRDMTEALKSVEQSKSMAENSIKNIEKQIKEIAN